MPGSREQSHPQKESVSIVKNRIFSEHNLVQEKYSRIYFLIYFGYLYCYSLWCWITFLFQTKTYGVRNVTKKNIFSSYFLRFFLKVYKSRHQKALCFISFLIFWNNRRLGFLHNFITTGTDKYCVWKKIKTLRLTVLGRKYKCCFFLSPPNVFVSLKK